MSGKQKSTPLVQLVEVRCEPPSLQDNSGDIDRLRRNVTEKCGRPVQVPFGRLAAVASAFRHAAFQGLAVINDMDDNLVLVDFLVSRPASLPAMALDLGTTHLEASLVDLLTGKELARSDTPNGQIELGADILSRIHHCASKEGQQQLQQAVVDSIMTLASQLTAQLEMSTKDIRALTVSGNTTMVHLLLGLDPATICREPYIPMVNRLDSCLAADIGLSLHAAAPLWLFPSVGSYFGGDLVAGIIAAELDSGSGVSLLVDVGTNAEVVLGNSDWLIACAGAAGPALEGGIARMGMRAGPGAIEKVRIDPQTFEVKWQTIGTARPQGLCGSGIIDLVAAFYLAQIIDVRGKFCPDRCPHLFVDSVDGPSFVVVDGSQTAQGEPLLFSQVDLDAMMRSKAAMYSILTTLLAQVQVEFAELAKIYVAGSFGKHIDPRQAITLGMMPDLPLSTFEAIGNSSLAGARAVLLDGAKRARALELPQKITYLELNVNQEFMIRFSGCRFIPHTDPSLFPSVPVFS